MLLALMVAMTSWAQGISGTVIDDQGEAVIGASIVEKGNPQNGTITDFDGKFTIKVKEGTPIVISYIGYVSQELKATSGMRVTLREDAQTLQDVVVIGYGVQKKSVVTASIAKVSAEDLEGKTRLRADDALKGLAAGVNVTSASGQPGAQSMIRVRGTGTINDTKLPRRVRLVRLRLTTTSAMAGRLHGESATLQVLPTTLFCRTRSM